MIKRVQNKERCREILLMTGTISPFVPTILSSEEDRCDQYVDTITRYILESPFTDIIFAENSSYDFTYHSQKLADIAQSKGKKF